MASWITHMMIADSVLAKISLLDRRGFCVGNVAPDCNIENKDWTAFVPSREETHWMSGDRKGVSDCERFWKSCIENKRFESDEERSFYLGYYSHLVADARFQKFTRDELRVANMMARIRSNPDMASRMSGRAYDYDEIKRVFSKKERLRDVAAMEYEYLQKYPQSGYLTVLRVLSDFPDYLENFPKGAVVRKMGVMATLPEAVKDAEFVFITREEYDQYVRGTVSAICEKLRAYFE